MKRKTKVPKTSKHWYTLGYKRGYLAGSKNTTESLRSKAVPSLDKVWIKEEGASVIIDASQSLSTQSIHAIKWEGFTEAMELITRSKNA